MKNFTRKVFNRLTLLGVIMLIQIIWLSVIFVRLGTYALWVNMLFNLVALMMVLFIIYRDDNPAYKMGWIMFVCLIPALGALFYLFFGNKRPARRIKNKFNPIEQENNKYLEQDYDLSEIEDSRARDTVKYIINKGVYPAWSDTETEYFGKTEIAFERMLADLRKAKHYIFLEYFIISEGKMWNSIHEILKQKVAEGVDVRVIYDDFGSMLKISHGFKSKLKAEGIKVLAFNPIKPVASLVYNNRDHRKILVIDGNIAYTGGFNIADEYINLKSPFGVWKDSGLRLYGKAVWNFTVMFLNMWTAFTGEKEGYELFRPELHMLNEAAHDGVVQPYSDSPLDDENLGENVYLELINQSETYCYIATPYLILDNEMITALSLAAKRGVDVRIVTPGIPDKPLIYSLSRSYYRILKQAGIRIFEYTPGFVHSKCMLSDDKKGVVGTINFDYRSLFLHFECGTLMLGSKALCGLNDDFSGLLKESREVADKDVRSSFGKAMIDGILRAFAPML